MKKIVSWSIVVFMVMLMTIEGYSQIATGSIDGKAVNLKLGHNFHASSFTGKAITTWASKLSDKTGGKLKVDIFPQNQLGSNKELAEQTSLGSLDINIVGMSTLVDYKVEEGFVARLPFLFKSVEHAYAWWASPDGGKILKKAEANGRVRFLGFGSYRMPRQFASKTKIIKVPEDIRNLKMRASDTAANSLLKILGCVPTAVSLNEMYTALSQGMVDIVELPLDYIYDYSIFEVTKHLTLTNHNYDLLPIAINAKKFESLSPSFQKLLFDSMPGLEKDNNQMEKEKFDETLQKLKDKGMNVVATDRSLWEAIIPKVVPSLEKTWPSHKGLYEKIMNLKY